MRQAKSAAELAWAIEGLAALDRPALEAAWRRLHGHAPPKRLGRDLLLRVVAYQLQVEALGGLSPAARRRLQAIALALREGRPVPTAAARSIKPGTRLLREWHGQLHEVQAVAGGFLWQDRRWRSLSEIARAITGSRWSGPAFFGLTSRRGRSAREVADG